MPEIFTIGYQRWGSSVRLKKLIDILKDNQIAMLVDIRHSPCASQLDPKSNYGPRSWHLQENSEGIKSNLNEVNIKYLWLVELGNPQKQDKAMRIFRAHLETSDSNIPAQRGLKILKKIVEEKKVCLLCACKNVFECHRNLVTEKLSKEIQDLKIVHL